MTRWAHRHIRGCSGRICQTLHSCGAFLPHPHPGFPGRARALCWPCYASHLAQQMPPCGSYYICKVSKRVTHVSSMQQMLSFIRGTELRQSFLLFMRSSEEWCLSLCVARKVLQLQWHCWFQSQDCYTQGEQIASRCKTKTILLHS